MKFHHRLFRRRGLTENGDLVKVEVVVLVDDNAQSGLHAAHGFAALINCFYKKGEVKILFDTGPDTTLLNNALAMKTELGKVDVIALSHGHYDHTGGLLDAIKTIGRRIPIVVDPEAFSTKLAYKPALTYIGTPFQPWQIEAAGGTLVLTVKPTLLARGVTLTGRIERRIDEPSVKGLYVVKDGVIVKDEVPDDRALILNVNGRIMIVTGCAHAGVLNLVDEALRLTGANSIAILIGGLHLFNVPRRKAEDIARELKRMNVSKVAPCHCTGERGLEELRKVFGDSCIPLKAGSTYSA
ncbi:MAG: hypothetical protein DRN06_00620 [Thermoprotei archaeon]|nr:MAG: hypothetical protein DRN06_00620 [Thermoprotei archaeon]